MGQRAWQRWLLLGLGGAVGALLVGQFLLVSARWIHQPFPGFFVHENLTVGPYYLSGWSGSESGLRSLDTIAGVNGRDIHSRRELYDIVRRAPVGEEVSYRVLRRGRVIELTIATGRFSLRDWLFSFGIYSIIGLAFLVIGVAPYVLRASSPVALPLCLMVLTVFVWFQTTFDFLTEGMLPKELRLLALSLTPSAAIHLAFMLSGTTSRPSPRRWLVAASYPVGFALAVLNSATFFDPQGAWPIAFRANYIYIFAGAAAFLLLTGVALRRCESDLERSRLRVVFVGALLGFLLPALAVGLAATTPLQIAYNLALIPTVFFPVSVAYALLKYSLFDLGHALRVGLSRVALLALLLVFYATLAFLLEPWMGDFSGEPLVVVFFSIFVIALFNPLLRWLERTVDRYIFRQEYDPSKVQKELSLYLRRLDNAGALARRFLERTTERLGIANALIVYQSRKCESPVFFDCGSQRAGLEDIPSPAAEFGDLWPAADYRGIARAEVKNDPRYEGKRAAMLGLFDRCRAELLVPLVYEEAINGVLAIGGKRSGGEFSAEDFRLLGTLADQLALSLENGRLYQESLDACRRAEASNDRLREADRIKKDFVANICHELRTPLCTVIGYGEVLREFDMPQSAREILNRMIDNGRELSCLMDNLMNFSRLEADGPSVLTERVQLKEILGGLEVIVPRLIRQRPIQFRVEMDSAVDAVESDGQKLQQILVELLTNSVKFTERGKIELSVRTRNDAAGAWLEFAVADTGIGIRQEDQSVIFEDFRQVDGASTRRYGGTGVGLCLSRKLAVALGGDIHVESEVGIGSVFSLVLPLRPSEAAGVSYIREQQESLAPL